MTTLHEDATVGRPPLSVVIVSVAVAAAIFAFDLSLPLGVAGGVPYVALVLVGLWSPWRPYLLLLALAATVLTILGYALAAPGGEPWVVATNRALAVFAIWTAAVLAFQRKRSAAGQHESEKRYRDLVEASPDAILVHSGGKIVFANTAAATFLGYQGAQDLIGIPAMEIIPPEDRGEINERQQRTKASDRRIEFGEERFARLDGSVLTAEVSATPFSYGGEPAIQVIARDITERKEAEVALREAHATLEQRVQERTSELQQANDALEDEIARRTQTEAELRENQANLQAILDHAPVNIALKDLDGQHLMIGTQSLKMFGLPADSVYGKTSNDLFPKALADSFVAQDRAVLESGKAIEQENQIELEDGVHTVLTVKFPLPDSANGIRGIGAISTDITERKKAEKGLRESEARLTDAIESMKDGFALFDAEDRLVLCNSNYRVIWKGIDDLLVPGTKFETMARVAAERGLFSYTEGRLDEWVSERVEQHRAAEGVQEHQFGDGRWIQAVERRTFDGGIVCIRADITERKKAEQALHESEARFKDIAETTSDRLWEMDESLRFTSNFEQPGRDSLPSPDHFIGRTRWEAAGADPDADEMWRHHRDDLLARRPFRDFEFTINDDDGVRQYMTVSGTPVFDSGGAFRGYRGSATNITERKRAEETLRQQEQRLRGILDNVADGVVTIDDKGRIESFNPAAETMFGYAADEVIGKNVAELMPGPDRDRHDSYIRAYLDTGVGKIIGVGVREVTARHKDGTTFPIELAVGELKLRDERVFVGAMRDITDRAQLEEQLRHSQKMEAVGQLTGGIAHEFNNLLTVILGNLELLDEQIPAAESRSELVQKAKKGALRGAELTDRLLAFSRKQRLEPKPVDLGMLLSEMHDLLGRGLEETVAIELNATGDTWTVHADPGQIQNAVLNLALNARDAMPGGGLITIGLKNVNFDADKIAAHPEGVPGEYVMLTVSDRGAGMEPEVVAHAFEPFFTTKDVGQGTGLGLSMVYGFVKQSGGFTEIESEVGKGTTVALYLPRVTAEPEEVSGERHRADSYPGGDQTILVVEDDPEVRRLAANLLASLGYEVVEAKDGDSALTILGGDRHIDLLFTDVVMPGAMSGLELAKECRRRYPGLKIVFASGYSKETVSQEGEMGAEACLVQKPYRKMALAHAVRDVLSS